MSEVGDPISTLTVPLEDVFLNVPPFVQNQQFILLHDGEDPIPLVGP